MATYDLVEIPLTVERMMKDTRLASVAFEGFTAPTPPVFGAFDPVAGEVAREDPVEATVTDPDGFGLVMVWAEMDDGTLVLVYDGTAFSSAFDDASTISGTTTKTIVVQHNAPGWTDDYVLKVRATDTNGASATASAAYTLSDPPAPVVPDETPPVVTVVSPTPPGPLGRNDAVRLRVTDGGTLKRVWLFVTMNGEQYVVHNGYSFRPAYSTGSTRTAIEGGYEFVLLRTSGWFAAPTFEVQATDDAGNER